MAIYMQSEPKKIYIRVDAQPITTPGIYHNESEGLISYSSNGTNWTTIQDKNLGATTAGTTSASYGGYYPRGARYSWEGVVSSSYTIQDDWSAGVQSIAPSGYHIPAISEITSLLSLIGTITGSSTTESFQKYAILPLTGYELESNTTVKDAGSRSFLWSTKVSGGNGYFFRVKELTEGSAPVKRKLTIRLFKDTGVQPNDSWTVLYQ